MVVVLCLIFVACLCHPNPALSLPWRNPSKMLGNDMTKAQYLLVKLEESNSSKITGEERSEQRQVSVKTVPAIYCKNTTRIKQVLHYLIELM